MLENFSISRIARLLKADFFVFLICIILPSTLRSQPWPYPPDIPDAQVEIYKQIGDTKLQIWIFTPKAHRKGDQRPTIVFFFGGSFRWGSPIQFAKHCEYLAARGMVAMTVDYRVIDRHGGTALDCVADAKSAIRWVRKNAARLGIDSNRIAAGGASSGGHLAAATALLPGFDDPDDDTAISAKPNALVLFNPTLIRVPMPGIWQPTPDERANFEAWFGKDAKSFSPFHHITQNIAPAIILSGIADSTVSYKAVKLFCDKMREKGNNCKLIGYKGASHGFFNFGRGENAAFIDTVYKMDKFLVSLGYLSAPPEVESY